MTFTEAVKRPFQDLKTLVIGIIVMLIPIVNFTIGLGYILECAKTSLKNNKKLPPWKNWGDLFVKGLVAFVITLIYAIPVIIVLALTVGTAILTGGISAMFTEGSLVAMNSLATLGIGLVLTVIVGVIMSLLSTVAIIRYAEKGNFGSAFEMSAIFKKAFTGTYFAAWLVSMIYALVVVVLLAFIPLVGAGIGAFLAGVAVYTYLAEAYKKA